jgi:hypothetical protein
MEPSTFFLVERVKPVFQFFVFAPLYKKIITGRGTAPPFCNAPASFYGR